MSDEPETLQFSYKKSPQYRTIHCDGVMGSVTPKGDSIFLVLFNERHPIPQAVFHELSQVPEGHKLGPEIVERREGLSGVLRETEMGMFMTLETAKHVSAWLAEKVKAAEQAQKKRKAK